MEEEGIGTTYDSVQTYEAYSWQIPDVLGYIQSKTELTRSTLYEILNKSGRMEDVSVNPQLFFNLATQSIKRGLMIDGIKYEKNRWFGVRNDTL